MSTTSSSDLYLAEELIFKILLWVPVLSLLRFKSVCKSWFSIISSPTFIETRLDNSKKQQPSSLIWLSETLSEKSYLINDAVYVHTIVNDPVRINLPRNFIGMNCCFRSCNGLLFHDNISGFTDSLYGDVSFIWNPLTKQLKILPTPEKPAKNCGVMLGFGFDFISSHYKILRMVFREVSFHPVLEAELYSASGDSWKEIQVPDALRSFRPATDSNFVHANGVMYLEGTMELLAFDLHCEVFRVFSFPNPLQLTRMSDVLDHEDSVAIIFEEYDTHGSVLSLWTLDDVSWTKKYNLEADLKVLWVFLYLGAGLFVVGDCNREYIFYDHGKKQTKKFPLTIFLTEATVASYTESLVSLQGFEEQE